MWAVLVLVGAAAASAPFQSHQFEGEKVFRVTPRNEDQVEFINNLASNMQIDFWNPESVTQVRTEMKVDFRVEADKTSAVESFLEQSGVEYEILIDNLKTVLDAQFDSKVRTAGHSYVKYNNWDTITAWTADIAAQNAKLVSRTQIGTTFQERPMYLLKVGKSGSNKKAIFMDCGFHAREWISPAFCQWFVKEAVSTYGSDTVMTHLLDNVDFYILPVLNIDGYVYTWTNYRMWRKTRSTNAGSSCIGTDPNRNFNAGWCSVGASRKPCDDTYCGSAPESEKETKALADFIRKNLSTIKAYLTIHSYSQMLLFPYSYTYSLVENHAELLPEIKGNGIMLALPLQSFDRFVRAPTMIYLNSEAERKSMANLIVLLCTSGGLIEKGSIKRWFENTISKAAVQELAALYGTKYTYGAGASTIYPAAGGSDDWAYDQGIKYSFTFELRDTGRYGFALPESQIKPTCEETMKAVKYIANYVLNHLY